MKNVIYGYPLYSKYKYIIAHTTSFTRFKYNALDGTNSFIKAIIKAKLSHHNDKLEWVVIKNF